MMSIGDKYLAKEMGVFILVRYVICGDKWLHGFGGLAASYISDKHFEQLAAGNKTECSLGVTQLSVDLG